MLCLSQYNSTAEHEVWRTIRDDYKNSEEVFLDSLKARFSVLTCL